ncbi:type II secretion system minor pseudopilin GspI [Fertoebacter nigrum]|uniref:Type II secretion system protein I n=1 Tax=Fertoeibacter niger TaxID=2656921 RepID=A0A8X8GQZ7_9RHOB|nr:type II secretion system minor pseudopilin GspI [Fertoeibacter niger]NUB42759.1 type II secretion system minor pseudopilin GspI [Fertoeibacter niger]
MKLPTGRRGLRRGLPRSRRCPQDRPAQHPARRPEAGFTLIETLVALAVLATSAVALLGATEAHIARIGGLEARAAAQWVAENHLAERTLGVAPQPPGPVLGFAFAVTEDLRATTDPGLSQIDITVADSADGTTYARLTGFLAQPQGGGG